ncbi:MAG: DUF444 family protein [Deltaproteobacteria bacterium]|nr:DUF444 family protein [Deltaproteobacteria bacterium]
MVLAVPDGCRWKRTKRSGLESAKLYVSSGSTEGSRDPSTPARGRWGDSNRIAPGSVPVLRNESAAVVAEQRYPRERLPHNIYDFNDQRPILALEQPKPTSGAANNSIDRLLARDDQREKDGFPRKIRIGRLVKPGKSGKGNVVVVPTTVEEKFMHDNSFRSSEESESGGSGDGEEGEIIGEAPVHAPEGEGSGAGQGGGGAHEIESSAYDLGRILTEKFELPNLKDKGAKRVFTRYTYDMSDRNRGFGQVLDKKATLRQVLKTNFALGRIPDVNEIESRDLLVSPSDEVYRILSKEKDYESQAIVFFLRDYSASMIGKCTELVVSQHILIYSWLLYQYAKRVETRFILHDTEAKEVFDLHTYSNSSVAGGTQVSSAYRLVNQVVEKEGLARDYNIYVFHGSDGDDWDAKGEQAVPELVKMIGYVSRIGITIIKHSYAASQATGVENYVRSSGLLEKHPHSIRLDAITEDASEGRLIEGIRNLTTQDAKLH